MLLALRGGGWGSNIQKKALRNTLMAPNCVDFGLSMSNHLSLAGMNECTTSICRGPILRRKLPTCLWFAACKRRSNWSGNRQGHQETKTKPLPRILLPEGAQWENYALHLLEGWEKMPYESLYNQCVPSGWVSGSYMVSLNHDFSGCIEIKLFFDVAISTKVYKLKKNKHKMTIN